MAEYIEREAVEKYIESLYQPWEHRFQDRDNIKRQLKRIPTADVVEVVRCKNCVHWGGITFGFVCRKFSGSETKICMGADHYCSYGERKDNVNR